MDDEPKYYACVHSKYDLLENKGDFYAPKNPVLGHGNPVIWRGNPVDGINMPLLIFYFFIIFIPLWCAYGKDTTLFYYYYFRDGIYMPCKGLS